MDTFTLSSIVNFAVVLVMLWYFGRKPAAEFFAQRSSTIENAIAEAEAQSFDAQKLLAKWETNWKSCEADAKAQFDEAKTTLARFREKALAASRLEAERIHRDATLLGNSEVLKAKASLRQELAEKSVHRAGQLLRGQLDDRDRRKLVADYVEIVTHG